MCSDSGDSDGVDSETDTPKKARKAEKREEKNNKEVEKGRWKKESREKMTSAHHNKKHSSRGSPSSSERKHSRSKHACNSKTEHFRSKTEKLIDPNIAIISKSRITRQLGIYNKAKRSNTIVRENLKQKVCKKKFENVKAKTAEDMAKVLDCSSFKIQLSCSGSLQEGQDSPVQHILGERDSLIQSSAGTSKTQRC